LDKIIYVIIALSQTGVDQLYANMVLVCELIWNGAASIPYKSFPSHIALMYVELEANVIPEELDQSTPAPYPEGYYKILSRDDMSKNMNDNGIAYNFSVCWKAFEKRVEGPSST
jgi:hypothetical protein